MAQWYCTAGGARHGPVETEVLRQWLAEGRVKPSDLVWTEGMADWQAAASVIALGAPFGLASAAGAAGAPPPIPFAGQPYSYAPQYAKPHRANMLLVFGILGLVVCVIFGIASWVMASNDLREMDGGIMDPSGRSTTNTARILGMVSSILAIVGVALGLLGLFLSLGLRAHSMR